MVIQTIAPHKHFLTLTNGALLEIVEGVDDKGHRTGEDSLQIRNVHSYTTYMSVEGFSNYDMHILLRPRVQPGEVK